LSRLALALAAAAHPLVFDRFDLSRPRLHDGLGSKLEEDLCWKGVAGMYLPESTD
jgi:hypothetical protein